MKSRKADYPLLNKIKNFKAGAEPDNSTGLRHAEIESNLYEKVSSPMLLARLVALIPGLKIETFGQLSYKITWHVAIEHSSGLTLTFYDFKGAASIGIEETSKPLTKSQIKDINNLIHVLTNERCPHPYDDCVVGEIA